jgi:hypothetical protein
MVPDLSARGRELGWKRWSSSSGAGVLYLVWHFSDGGESKDILLDLDLLSYSLFFSSRLVRLARRFSALTG